MDKFAYYFFGLKLPLLVNFAIPAILLYSFLAKLMKNKYIKLCVFVFIPTLILIRLLRNDPFFISDDFDHLNLAYKYGYLDIITKVIGTAGIWVNNRIIIGFWIFEAIYNLFGPKTEVYLLAMYAFQVINVFLFYLITKRFVKSRLILIFTTVVISSFFLTWISNIHEVVGATFILLSALFFLRWLSHQSSVSYSLTFYILAILTKEIAFMLPLVLVLLAAYHHFNISRLSLGKLSRSMLPFFGIFITYLLTYAYSFRVYFIVPAVDSYKMGLSIPGIIHNLLYYLTYNFPIIDYSAWGISFIALLLLYDVVIKKIRVSPFVFSYLIFLFPVLLFVDRHTFYYAYIPTFFLFMGLSILLADLHNLLVRSLAGKSRLYLWTFNVYLMLLLTVGVFRLDKLLLDNTFLIQFPRSRHIKEVILSVAAKAEECYRLAPDDCSLKLSDEDYEKIKFPVVSRSIYVFLSPELSRQVIISLDPGKKALIVEKR